MMRDYPEPFEIKCMRRAAWTVEDWTARYGREAARAMVLQLLAGVYDELCPEFRAAYKTAFGG